MPIWMGHLAEREGEWEKAAGHGFLACLESVEAALWLIAGGRQAQALVQFQSAVEVALKAFLNRIDPTLAVEAGSTDGRTIKFKKAVGKVADRLPWVAGWTGRLGDLFDLRNEVAHRGSNGATEGRYAECIATVAFPFLGEFLRQKPHELSLENAMTPDIRRELQVADKVCEKLCQGSLPVGPYVLYTVGLATRYAWVDWPRPEHRPGVLSSRNDDFELAEQARKYLPAAWGDEVVENHLCAICCGVNLFVHVRHVAEPERRLIPLAARCPKCGLEIDDEDRYLAEHHVRPFPPEVVDRYFKDLPR